MAGLEQQLQKLASGLDGRVGIGVQTTTEQISVHGKDRFPLQSVMKMVIAAAVMEDVDQKQWRLSDPILVRREDLSLFHQPLAALVKKDGYRTTIGELMRRAVVDSDNAAADILLRRMGGSKRVATFLTRHGIHDLRVDRDERHLQTELVGLTWKPDYVDSAVLDRAIKAVPTSMQEQAFRRYLRDPRDTATPEAMASFTYRLAAGKLLSPGSTKHLVSVMRQTATGPDRLKAGTPKGWLLGHKTGTSGSYKGITLATNDVGVLTSPTGKNIAVAVFVTNSRRSADERAALIADVARAVTAYYR